MSRCDAMGQIKNIENTPCKAGWNVNLSIYKLISNYILSMNVLAILIEPGSRQADAR